MKGRDTSMRKLIAFLLILCVALAALTASAERENVTDVVVYELGPGEVQLIEIGDITVPEGKSGMWFTGVKGHGIISAGQITTVTGNGVNMDVTDGSLIVSCGDIDHTVEGGLAQLKVKDGGFLSLTGGDFRTPQGQGFLVMEENGSSVRIHIGEAESKGTFGMMADVNGGSTLMFNAKKMINDGEYGLWLKIRGNGNGSETRASISIDELEGTNYALDLQQYNSGYYSVLRFGNVTAGNIGLKLMPERGTATDILVEGDISAGRIGVRLFSDDTVKLIVLGTINAPEAPILAVNMSGKSGVGINDKTQGILAWRIIPTASGHTVMLEGRESESVTKSASTEVLEKAIRYIIRTEESDKASFTLKKADGEEIRYSFGYPVACEGERVLVEVQAADGYTVTGVMNGEEEKVPLEQDENGSWYFDMPRGGGISLFAVTEPAA